MSKIRRTKNSVLKGKGEVTRPWWLRTTEKKGVAVASEAALSKSTFLNTATT